jgi:ribosome maturation protein SDO1
VSEKERKSEYDTLYRVRPASQALALPLAPHSRPQDVVQVLVDKCVNPDTGRPYTSGVLDRAMRAAHYAVDPTRSAKQQALDALPRLQREFPIVRARMRFRLCVRSAEAPLLRSLLLEQPHTLEAEESTETQLTGAPSPALARGCALTGCAGEQ